MDTNGLLFLITTVIGFLIALTIHEFSHAWVAYKLGDPTAKAEGRLTLNPLKHLDPLGLLALFIIRIGWAKPVPINPYNFKNPKKDTALVALAGPASNLILAFILIFISRILTIIVNTQSTMPLGIYTFILSTTIFTGLINIMLAIFNLIPIPPLDGYKLLQLIIPDEWSDKLTALEQIGPIFVLLLFYFGRLGNVIVTGSQWVFDIFKAVIYSLTGA